MAPDCCFEFPWSDFNSLSIFLLFLSCSSWVLAMHPKQLVLGFCGKNSVVWVAQTETHTAHSSGGCKGDGVAGVSARGVSLVCQKQPSCCVLTWQRGEGAGGERRAGTNSGHTCSPQQALVLLEQLSLPHPLFSFYIFCRLNY